MIDSQLEVMEIVQSHPECAPVLERLGIFPVPRSLEEACHRNELDLEAVLAELMLVINEPASAAPRLLSDEALVAYIVSQHHQTLRATIASVLPLMEKVVARHQEQNPKLAVLRDQLQHLSSGLLLHMEEEEFVLFPLFASRRRRTQEENQELVHLHDDHAHVQSALEELRAATDHYTPPEWACSSYRVLLQELKVMDSELQDHVRLEEHVLLRLGSA